MPITKKLTTRNLENIEWNQHCHLNRTYFANFEDMVGGYGENPAQRIEGYIKHAPSQASQRQRSQRIKYQVLQILTKESSTQDLKTAISQVEPYFEGNRAGASPAARTLFKNFQYANDLMLNAWEHFTTHLQNQTNFFSKEVYQQWLTAVKVGLYSACDFYVLGTQGLNYPDLNNNPSPRLEAVKSYYQQICVTRFLVEVLEQEATRWGRESNSISLIANDWTDYLQDCRQQLTRNFDEQRATQIFREIFGSPDPSQPNPQEMDTVQMKFFTRLSEELLRGVQPAQPTPTPTGINRDYTRLNDPPPTPVETNHPNQQNSSERPRKQERSPSPPRTTEFNSSTLNDIVNSLFDNLEQDSQASGQGDGSGFTPSPGLGMPLNSIMKEDAQKMPWLAMSFNLAKSGEFDWISFPQWEVHDPKTAAFLSHGEGSVVTLALTLERVEQLRENDNYDRAFHNFFWTKDLDKKGFIRLEKDNEPITERKNEQSEFLPDKDRERERERANC